MTFRLHTVYFRSCSQVNVCDKAFPFKVGDNQRPERTMTGVRKPLQFIPAGFPPHDNLQPGTEDSAGPLTTPDTIRSERVLQTSVK